jgi:hypothetical protein
MAAVLVGCGSASWPTRLGDVCGRYASAAAAIVPAAPPPPVPSNFAVGLKATALRDCEQLAVKFGYARNRSDPKDGTVTRSQSIRLIGTLTAHTVVRVPGIPVPDKYQVGIPLGGAQRAPPAHSQTP